jgi:hypothetical protein
MNKSKMQTILGSMVASVLPSLSLFFNLSFFLSFFLPLNLSHSLNEWLIDELTELTDLIDWLIECSISEKMWREHGVSQRYYKMVALTSWCANPCRWMQQCSDQSDNPPLPLVCMYVCVCVRVYQCMFMYVNVDVWCWLLWWSVIKGLFCKKCNCMNDFQLLYFQIYIYISANTHA